jgi:tetratricopeptide (TPR) repeat protein
MTATPVDLRPTNRWLYVAIAMLLALSVSVQMIRDRGWAPFVPPTPTMWLQSGVMANRLALSFDSIVADAYWIRAVVYYGGSRLRSAQPDAAANPPNFELLYPLLDLVTSLDPHFKVAYRFGAIFLTEAYPSGPGRPDQAVALLQRGIERDSARWEYMEDIGFVYYWWLRDFTKAAEWFKRASEHPGAPSWLAPLAATTLTEGGDRRASRFLWTRLLQESDVDWVRRNARLRLRQLDAMEAIDELNRYAARFASSRGRAPRDLRELAEAEGFRALPRDPDGEPYVIDPATGKVDLAPASLLRPLPWEPAAVKKPS